MLITVIHHLWCSIGNLPLTFNLIKSFCISGGKRVRVFLQYPGTLTWRAQSLVLKLIMQSLMCKLQTQRALNQATPIRIPTFRLPSKLCSITTSPAKRVTRFLESQTKHSNNDILNDFKARQIFMLEVNEKKKAAGLVRDLISCDLVFLLYSCHEI